MARGRFISESVAKDARLNSLSLEAELVYLMTIPHLDRDGLIDGDPDVLWGTVCPKRRQLIDRMAAFVQEWAKAGLVLCYDTEEGVVLWFKGFTKNQIGLRYERETPSRFPPPPGYYRGTIGIVAEPPAPESPQDSDTTPPSSGEQPEEIPPSADSIRQESGNAPAEVRQMSAQCQEQVEVQVEVKGEGKVKGQGNAPPPAPPAKPAVLRSRSALRSSGSTLKFESPYVDNTRFDLDTGFIRPGVATSAVEVYYERFDVCAEGQRLTVPMEDDLVRLCPDLNKLREVIVAYSRAGFKNQRNIQLILDWYSKGIPDKYAERAAAPSGSDYKPPSHGRVAPVDRSQLEAEKLRAMLKEQGMEHILHG